MRIRLSSDRSSGQYTTPAGATITEAGHTYTEFLVVATTLAVVIGAMCVPLSAAFCVVRSTRENLRATQIVMQKAEALHLFNRSQVGEASSPRQPLFVQQDDPQGVTGNRGGVEYTGYVSAAPAAGNGPAVAAATPGAATVTLYWTNYAGGKPIVQTRDIRTRLARNGAPKYIWGAP
jgi:hypothetical protein